jgi:predicted TIM-barrel fold metal-dependent hydrolase
MFGADYPLFTYERLVSDWRSLGYDDAILAQVMQGNAARLFGLDQAA